MVWCCAALVLAWVDFAVGASLSGTMTAPIINDLVVINVEPFDCVGWDVVCSASEAFLADDVPVRHVAIAELLNNLTLA